MMLELGSCLTSAGREGEREGGGGGQREREQSYKEFVK